MSANRFVHGLQLLKSSVCFVLHALDFLPVLRFFLIEVRDHVLDLVLLFLYLLVFEI